MKNTLRILVALMFIAQIAFASDPNIDIGIDNRNTITNTATSNAEANSDQNQQQGQDQEQKQRQQQDASSKAVVTSPRDFISAPAGPQMLPVVLVPEVSSCVPVDQEVLTLDVINNMVDGDWTEKKGGWWHGLWSSRVKKSVRYPFEGEHHNNPISVFGWDKSQGLQLYPGDKIWEPSSVKVTTGFLGMLLWQGA